jgi:hypothetical protein
LRAGLHTCNSQIALSEGQEAAARGGRILEFL